MTTVLAAAACGGSGGNGASAAEPTGPQLTKAQFLRKADRVCRLYNDRNSALRAELPRHEGQLTEADRATAASVYRRFATNVRAVASKLGQLSPPAAVENQWQQTVVRLGNFADAIDDYADAVKDDDAAAIRSAQAKAAQYSIATDPFIRRYGFEACGGAGPG